MTAAATRPTPDEMKELQEKFTGMIARKPYIPSMYFGALLLGLVGTIFAIVSLRTCKDANWRAWISLPICGLWMLCNCGLFGYSLLHSM